VKQYRKIVLWAYVVEVLFAGLAQSAIILLSDAPKVANFVNDTAGAWASFTGVLLAAALAVWIVLFQVATTPFGEWLMWRGAMRVYSQAFAYAVVLYAGGTVLLIICMSIKSAQVLTHIALFALLLGTVNLVTMVMTTKDLLQLQAEFRQRQKEFDREKSGTLGGPKAE